MVGAHDFLDAVVVALRLGSTVVDPALPASLDRFVVDLAFLVLLNKRKKYFIHEYNVT